MIVRTAEIENWRSLQDHVATLFREMGYEATTLQRIDLAGRGRKEIDVYVMDPRASVNQVMLVECKFWETSVPQDTVHSFHTVMSGAGANTGFIVSKVGFQSGAYEAALNTNIHLLAWEELQHKFGKQWYLYQSDLRDKILADMRVIDHLHLDQYSPLPAHNNMFFIGTGMGTELCDILADLRVAQLACIAGPKTYDAGPVDVQVYEGFPGAIRDKYGLWVLRLDDSRKFFEWFHRFGRSQLERFEALSASAHAAFDKLPDGGEAAMAKSRRAFIEESPIRLFKEALGAELYDRVIRQHMARGSPTNAEPNDGG